MSNLLEDIVALRNWLIVERERLYNPRTGEYNNPAYREKLNAAIGALNALLPEKLRVY